MTSKNVAIYVRTSTDKQEKSIELQKEELRKYCNNRNFNIIEEYVDYAYSGSNTERPAFQNMMKDAEDKKFEILIVTKIDRFARSMLDCLTNVEKLQSYDVAFVASSQPIDTTDAMGKLTLQIMSAFAEFERAIINERMLNGRVKAEKEGKVCHRHEKKLPLSKNKILEYLFEKKLSCNAIAKICDVSSMTMKHRLNKWGYKYQYGEWVEMEDVSTPENPS